MQDTGTGADIWRRATQAPTPRLALRRSHQVQALDRPARWAGSRIVLPLVAAALGATAVLGLFGTRPQTTPAAALAGLERVAELAGFGLQQVAVTGQRFTADGDIFDALDLANARTLLGFDNRAAQRRIEQLPWVARANMERVFPDRLNITIVERQAFAVWQLGARYHLIDKSGRRLSVLPANALPALRRIAGEGADIAAAGLFAALARYPEILRRLDVAERVGGRRWTLRLSGGAAVHLPAEAYDEALAQASELVATGYANADGSIDLRVANRTVLRAGKGGGETAARAGEASPRPGRI